MALAAVLSLALPAAPAGADPVPALGDVDGDGSVDDRDLTDLDGLLGRAPGDRDRAQTLAADVDLNGRLDEGDRELLTATLAERRRSPDGPLAAFLAVLLGHAGADASEVLRPVARSGELDGETRLSALELLLGYLERGGGTRSPGAGEPGASLAYQPRDATAIMAGELMVHEATGLLARTARGAAADFDAADRIRAAKALADRLATAIEAGPLRPETFAYVQEKLTAAGQRLDEAALARGRPAPPASATPPGGTQAGQPDDEPTPARRGTPGPSDRGSFPWPLAAGGAAVAAAVAALVANSLRRPAPETVTEGTKVPTVVARKAAQRTLLNEPGVAALPRSSLSLQTSEPKPQPADLGPVSAGSSGEVTRPALPAEVDPALAGVLPERYRVVGQLGKGGQGVVFKAEDRELNRLVAIKVLLSDSGSNNFLRRLIREAETLAGLSCQGVPQVYDLQKAPLAFIVMEFIEGRSLRKILRAGRPPYDQAMVWTRELFQILTRCHDAQVLHRDVKPENVIIDPAGRVYLVDFGLVKREGDTQLTHDGRMVGTLPYLAPEQFKNDVCTVRSDLYSAGLVAVEMLCGAHPFPNQHPFPPQVHQDPLQPHLVAPDLSPRLGLFLLQVLAREPAGRPESARAVLDGLARSLAPRGSN